MGVAEVFYEGLAPSLVRWEVSYEGKCSAEKLEIMPDPKFQKMSRGAREFPRTPQNIKKKMGPKGPWAQFWAQGRRHEAAALEFLVQPHNPGGATLTVAR